VLFLSSETSLILLFFSEPFIVGFKVPFEMKECGSLLRESFPLSDETVFIF
jgi:hypothetical protein